MSLLEFIEAAAVAWPVLLVVAAATPVALWLYGRFARDAVTSRVFGHLASGLVALGLLAMVFASMVFFYLHRRGTDLVAGVPVDVLIAPYWFGIGNLLAATRVVPFANLRTYPLLRRVWTFLSLAALVLAAWMVLKHTYWLVFSGIIGFLVVAIVIYVLARKLWGRATSPPPTGGDADLFDEVAAGSRRRASRLFRALYRSPDDD